MDYQNVLFGSFTVKETSDLCTLETADLQFVWLDRKKSPKSAKGGVAGPGADSGSSLTIPQSSVGEDMDKRSYSPSLLSPSIPPNPPSSPIDEQGPSHRRRLPAQGGVTALSKLNVNAVPFVPAKLATDVSAVEPQKNDFSSVRKLDFDQMEDGATKKVSGDDSGIVWEQMTCHIPPRPQPCGSIQTSGQVTSESNTTSVGDRRDSGQTQCRSQEEPAADGTLLRLGASVSSSANYSSAGENLVVSTISPVEQTNGSFQANSEHLPSLVASSPPISESHGDIWPEIPSSPPPPIPLPPSHYQKVHMADDSTPSCTQTSNSPVPVSSTDQLSNFSTSIGDNYSSSSQQPSVGAPGPTQNVGVASMGASPIPCESQSPPIVDPPLDAPPLTTPSTATPTLASLPQSPSAIPSPTIVSSVSSSATPTLALATSPVVPKSGAWGSNRVKSWASVFKDTPNSCATPTNRQPTMTQGKPTTVAMATNEGSTCQERSGDEASAPKMTGIGVAPQLVGIGGADYNVQLKKLGEQLSVWVPCHRPKHLQPRGLINSSNWCYVHAPLQALLSVPSMVDLFHSLDPNPPLCRGPSGTPFIDVICRFVHEYRNYPKAAAQPTPPTSIGYKKKKTHHRADLVVGESFHPKYIYDMLQKGRLNLSYKGRQEDAEEFLGGLLDGLHEEMVAANRLRGGQETEDKVASDAHEVEDRAQISSPSSTESLSSDVNQRQQEEVQEVGGEEGVAGEEWEQVGPKNKSTIVRQPSFSESPITEIFGGQFRSVLHRQGAKESAVMEPFFSLQLDIQSEAIGSVKDALEALATKETVHLSEVDAYKRLTLARLPPVLIFHLKRFVFNSSGSQKLFKFISYDMDMEISKDWLAPTIKNKLAVNQRSYRLWAVVYHHGKMATGGHYTCDAFHSGSGGWIRVDDGLVKPIPEDFVLTTGGGIMNKTVYLLFYRRKDTLH